MDTAAVAAIRLQLADARSAYHSLMTGTRVQLFLDQNGEKVQYTTATRADLYSYIQELQSKLPCDDPDAPIWPRPLTFVF